MRTLPICVLAALALHLANSRADAGLVAYYPFDSDFNDASGNGRHLTVGAGTPSFTSATGEHVIGGGALDLDKASNEHLTLDPTMGFATTDAWSVSFWARRRPGAGIATGMVVGDPTTTDSFIWIPDNSAQVQGLRFRPTGVGTSDNSDYATGHDADFHHWVVVADGTGTIRVYRDGVDLGTRSPSGGSDFDIAAVGSGYTGTNQLFDGQIDELRIYDEALDAADVDALFGLPPDTDPPILAADDIVDDLNGGPGSVGTTVTYTLTFSEDMDAATVDAADFGNAGTATFTIGAITEVSPGVFTVEITPTGEGTLQLEIPTSAEMADSSGNLLDTTVAIRAETVIPVEEVPEPAVVKRLRVFLIGGQSNADGRADPTGLPTSPVNLRQPQEDVDYFTGSLTTLRPFSQFGPEITLGRRLADSIADGTTTRIAIIKYAVGGTSLSADWKAGGDAGTTGDGSRYITFQQTVANGMAALAAAYPEAAIDIGGMLWVQGERDVVIGTHGGYEANLTTFIADVRATYGASLPFIISRLSIDQTALDAARLAVVRAAQAAVAAADPLSALLDTDGFGMKTDQLHFDAAGQQQLGNGGAEWLLDFHPFQSPPRIEARPAGEFGITVEHAFEGFVYTLRSSATLQAGDWNLEEAKTAAGDTVEFTVTPVGPRYFYRVERTMGAVW